MAVKVPNYTPHWSGAGGSTGLTPRGTKATGRCRADHRPDHRGPHRRRRHLQVGGVGWTRCSGHRSHAETPASGPCALRADLMATGGGLGPAAALGYAQAVLDAVLEDANRLEAFGAEGRRRLMPTSKGSMSSRSASPASRKTPPTSRPATATPEAGYPDGSTPQRPVPRRCTMSWPWPWPAIRPGSSTSR